MINTKKYRATTLGRTVRLLCMILTCLPLCLFLWSCSAEQGGVYTTEAATEATTTEAEPQTEPVPDTTEPPPPEPVSVIGSVKNKAKVTEDIAAKTITLKQKNANSAPPSFVFYSGEEKLNASAWAVTGTINTQTISGKAGHILFIANCDSKNRANIFINRRVGGSNGIWRNITLNGVRSPASANENVSNTLKDTTDWTGEFAFVFYNGRVALYLKEQEGEFCLMTYYQTDWESCTAEFAVNQYADVVLSDVEVTKDNESVKGLYDKLEGVPEDPIASKRVLFVGNSATYVNDVPGTLSRLARKAGYDLVCDSVTKGGATLAQHAAASTDWGKTVLNYIAGEYDIVFLQDNGNCVSTDATRRTTKLACKTLDAAIRAAGAETYYYVRPPYGYEQFGYSPVEQCKEFDKLFGEIASELGGECAYVNRAFACAIKELNVPLWGPDNGHTSPEGAYLAVCVFFSTLFDTSSTVLDCNGLPEDVARALQQVADKVVLEDYIPW